MKDSDFVNSSSWPKLTEWCSSCTRTRLEKLVLPREKKVLKEEVAKLKEENMKLMVENMALKGENMALKGEIPATSEEDNEEGFRARSRLVRRSDRVTEVLESWGSVLRGDRITLFDIRT